MNAYELPNWAAWHGRLMVVAWVILLPLGALIARYFKVTPGQRWPQQLDNKFWWRSHLYLQYAGVSVMTVGFLIAVTHADLKHSQALMHGLIGWAVVWLGWGQVAGGLLRGSKGGPQTDPNGKDIGVVAGDHYEMTRRRVIFEYFHKVGGYLTIALATADVALGLNVSHAQRWIVGVIVMAWVAGLLLAMFLQRSGRCMDTYQAIWGPSAEHPGNRRRPIGWGVRRVLAPAASVSKTTPTDPVPSSERFHEQ